MTSSAKSNQHQILIFVLAHFEGVAAKYANERHHAYHSTQ